MIRRRTKILSWISAVLLSTVFVFLLFQLQYFDIFDLQIQDKLFIKETVSDNVVIVGIDNESIKDYGIWPWGRDLHAGMIEKLEKSGVKTIGYDVTFSEKSGQDKLLLSAISKYDNLVFPLEGELRLKENEKALFKDVLMPLPEIKENSLIGHTTLVPDRDGKIRRAPLFVKHNEEQTVPFFVQILKSAGFIKDEEQIDELFVPDENDVFRINFFGPAKTFDQYSFASVMDDQFDSSIFEDKIVLVGAVAPDLHDEYFTPSSKSRAISGVEIQANLIESFIQNKTIQEFDNKFVYFILFLVLALLSGFIANKRIYYAVPLLLLLIVVYFVFVIVQFTFGVIYSILYPFLLILISFVAVYFSKYFLGNSEKRKLRAGFSQYVAKEVVDEIVKNPEKLKLGGESKEMTILFSDIRSFTALSEGMTPHELVEFLNEYLTLTTDVILQNKGVVDKFIGDAVMALWGAPLENENHAIDGATTALKMFDKLEEFNKKMKVKGLNQINIGIGLNTGEVVVGNLGSNQRFDYTVIGDPVNLASRLEGLTKYYGARIIISEKTKDQLQGKFVVKYLDQVAVKGKKDGVKIYEVKDFVENGSEYDQELQNFDQAIELYQHQEWQSALIKFEYLKERYSENKLVDIYLERLKTYIKNPPQDFDGVFRADFK
jgi:adenylate cyclase